ncbi:MAG: hypothetical protein DHS20C18_52010 [Saprospiraceae bacterium]|nr:MAG: hypothetical protein DHS20C18_52010 [Saprospiraceae bacterium]
MLKFFNPEEESQIIEAIQRAEAKTTGEIRVHLEDELDKDPVEQAVIVFQRLKMHKTRARNGVLILLAPEQKQFAIIGDEGINKVVPEDFWDEERKLMLGHFRQGEFCQGLCRAIDLVGEKLKAHFPGVQDDENELPDEISYN